MRKKKTKENKFMQVINDTVEEKRICIKLLVAFYKQHPNLYNDVFYNTLTEKEVEFLQDMQDNFIENTLEEIIEEDEKEKKRL